MTNSPNRARPGLRLFLVLIGLGFLAAAAATWFLQPPPKITAHTQLYVAAIPPKILFPERGQINHDAFSRNQAYLIKDRFTLNAALRDNPEIAELSLIKEHPNPLQWLEDAITVTFPSPEVMHISLSGDRPEEQKKIVIAVTKTYLESFVNKETTEFLARQRTLRDLSARLESQMRRKRQELRLLMEQRATDEEDLPILKQVALGEKKAIIQELIQVRQEIRRLQIELSLHPDKQKQEKLQLLKAMEKGLATDVARLDEETKSSKQTIVDLSGLKDEIENDERTLKLINDKLMRIDVEREAPLRITWPDKEAVIAIRPRQTGWIAAAAAVLAGLGSLLLLPAAFRFRGPKADGSME